MPKSGRGPDVTRSAVLAHLGVNGSASRADLARALGVSPALMTAIAKDLIAEGLVVERDETSAALGGRPARQLGLASSAGRAIGVKISADHVAFVEVGIEGTVRRSASEPFDAAGRTMLAELTVLLRRFVDGGGNTPLLGIGIGVPGIVDSQGNGIVDSVQLGWRQANVGPWLRREFRLPVLVENNVNALAAAERLYGVGARHRDFLVVTIGTGVGAGLVLDGAVVRGAGGGAGEFGHLPVVEDGPLCDCGNRGCLETFIGEAALVRTARERGVIPEESGIVALRALADTGDAAAAAVFGDAGHLLGRALAGVVNLLDPEIVVILGEGTSAWSHWSFGFEPALRGALMPGRRDIGVAVETWQDASWAQGAAALVLATPFDADGVAGDQGRLVRERLAGRMPEEQR
jgi:predicted NBD/HSP70 family sugar kinase